MPENTPPIKKPSIETLKKVGKTSTEKPAKASSITMSDILNTGIGNLQRSAAASTYVAKPITEIKKKPFVIPKDVQAKVDNTRINTALWRAELDNTLDQTTDNTIRVMAEKDGIKDVIKDSPEYNKYKGLITAARKFENTIVVKDPSSGKDIFSTEMPFLEGAEYSWNKYHEDLADGTNLLGFLKSGDDKGAKKYLNTPIPSINQGVPRVPGLGGSIFGGMSEPIMNMVSSGIAAAASVESLGLSSVASSGLSKLMQYGSIAPDAVAIKYGTALKDYYNAGVEQGMSDDEAYQKAKNAAIAASGFEAGLQIAFVGGGSAEQLISQSAKKTFGKSVAKYIGTPIKLGVIGSTAQATSDVIAKNEGIDIKDTDGRAFEAGKDLAVMDFAIRSIGVGGNLIGKGMKSAGKALLSQVNEKFRKDFVSSMEKSGVYPKGSLKQVEQEVASFKEAESKSPEFKNDEQRKNIVVGLTEKLIKLEEKQKSLHPDHQSSMNPEISDIKKRIEIAKTAKDPFEAEVKDDGTPLIKTEINATTETKKPIEESGTTGGVSEYQGTESVQAQEAIQADNSNRPVISEEEKVSIADNIRKFKIDESVLTGGDKGALQSNVAGLPIAVWNTSVEVVAKAVEAGEDISKVVLRTIKELKDKGHSFDEKEFKRRFIPEDVASNNVKARRIAESGMEGIGTEDYAELQIFANDLYSKGDIRNTDQLVKALRDYQGQKGDTSNIPDSVFTNIVAEATNPKFKPTIKEPTATKIKMPFEEVPKIEMTERDAWKMKFKGAYDLAKSVKDRATIAVKLVKEATVNKGINIDDYSLSKIINQFVTDKMDSDTASDAFADNLDEIIKQATNKKINSENKGIIKSIKKAAKSDSSTAAIYDTTKSIDFISPSKVENPEDYQALLRDYHRSINGEIPEGKDPRQALIDYVISEKEKADTRKRESLGNRYDTLSKKGKIKQGVSKDDFVDAMMDPSKLGTDELVISDQAKENVEEILNEDKEQEVDISEQHKENLRDAMSDGSIDDSNMVYAKQLLGVDTSKVSAKNIKLFNNIMEDLINGEDASRVNDILTDVEVHDTNNILKDTLRSRNIINGRTAGFFKKLWSKVNKGYKGSFKAYDDQGLITALRNATFNDMDTSVLYSSLFHMFDEGYRIAHNTSIDFGSTLNHIIGSKSAKIDGVDIKFTSDRLTNKNSYRVGIYGILAQYDDLYANIQSMVDDVVKMNDLSVNNNNLHIEEVTARKQALIDMGIVEEFTHEYIEPKAEFVEGNVVQVEKPNSERRITGVKIKEGLTIDDIKSKLNDREIAYVEYARKEFANNFDALNQSVRNNYGESLDGGNKNYLPQSVRFYGEIPEIDFEKPIEEGVPSYIQTLRASTTRDRTVNMATSVNRAGVNVHASYDWNYFKMIPEKFHETQITTHTAKPTKYISKLINSSDFKNWISGGIPDEKGISPYQDNAVVVGNKVKSYVNILRNPYSITKEIANQRSRISRYLYTKVLGSMDQVVRQTAPAQGHLIMEGGVAAWAKSNALMWKALTSESSRKSVIEFLKKTGVSDRVTGGFEVFHKELNNLDDNDILRGGKDVVDKTLKLLGTPLESADWFTSASSVMIAYMKVLKQKGIINNYSEFNLEAELEKGLDKDALAYSTIFLSEVNNVGNRAGKAKVFLENNAGTLRMLTSFNHNQTMNFLADVGRWSDDKSTNLDRKMAFKRMVQYAASVASYPVTAKLLNDLSYNLTKSMLRVSGVPLQQNNENEESINKLNWWKYAIGGAMDAMLGKQNLIYAEMGRGVGKSALNLLKGSYAEAAEKNGESIKGTWMAKDFNPIYTNDYYGISGTMLDKLEQYMNNQMKDDEWQDELVKDQRDAVSTSTWVQGIALLGTPSKDIERIGSYGQKVIKEHPVKQVWYDSYHFLRKDDPLLSEFERQESSNYIDMMLKKDKNYKHYLETKVIPYIEQEGDKELYDSTAKSIFSPKTVDILNNIKTKKGLPVIKALNNRYAGKDISNDKEVAFMVLNNAISVNDYAMAAACDKEGNLIVPKSEEEDKFIKDSFIKRYNSAYIIRSMKTTGKPVIQLKDEDILAVYKKLAGDMMAAKFAK